ncbi:hypothetical protein PCURB6_26760 [Paenibacillus curdlanolyticus]|nr:hypothetical protein PCURB6_26760 [Paenibacillus curdlanolyticus]
MGCLGYRGYNLKGWHSELDVLHRLDPEIISGGVLYTSGLSRGGNILYSKPCEYCQKYLKQFKLKAIYYALPDNTYDMMVI